MGIKISKDHLHPSVIESVTSGIGDVSQLETDAKGNAVEAINELLEKRDRTKELEADLAEGKEIIVEAVGEPLSKDDSFQDMSNDIKGLISQFKTNMMNSGVVVESGDKFKELIEKIQGLTEGEGNKGVKYAEGDCSGYVYLNNDYSNNMVINHNLGFIPQLFFVSMSITNYDITKCDVIVSNLKEARVNTADTRFNISVNITNISEDNCTLKVARDVLIGDATTFTASKWFAIGVGEEDTTLRDSLASILQEEGVSVTEEDDMASLITKVDEELLKGRYVLNADHSGYGLTIGEIARAAFMFSDTSWVSIGSSYTFPITGKVKISPTVLVAGTSSTGIVGRVKYRLTKKDGTVIHTAEMTKAEDGSGTVASFTIMVESGDVITTLGSINKAVSSVYPSIQHSAIITTNLIY